MANQNKSTHWQTTTEGQQKLCLLLIRLRFDLGPLYRGSAVTLALVSTATLDQFTPVNKKKKHNKTPQHAPSVPILSGRACSVLDEKKTGYRIKKTKEEPSSRDQLFNLIEFRTVLFDSIQDEKDH